MKHLLLSITACVALSSISYALPVRFLAWDSSVTDRKLEVLSGQKALPIVDLHTHYRSPLLNVSLGDTGLVIRALDRNTAEGKPIEFKIEKGTSFSKVLVILMPDSKAPSGLRGFAVDDSDSNFGWGDFRLINATGKPLGMVAGTVKKVIPADWTPIDLRGETTKALPIAFFSPTMPEKASYSALWGADQTIRRLVFIVNSTDARLGLLAVKVLVEDKASATAVGR